VKHLGSQLDTASRFFYASTKLRHFGLRYMWFCATLAGMKKLIMNYFGVLHASIWWLRLDPTAETEPAKLSKLLEPPGNQQYALWGLFSKTHQKYSGSFSCESIFPCQLSDGMHSFGSWMIEPDPPTTTETIRNHQKPQISMLLHLDFMVHLMYPATEHRWFLHFHPWHAMAIHGLPPSQPPTSPPR